jgi:hypothetical protein
VGFKKMAKISFKAQSSSKPLEGFFKAEPIPETVEAKDV